MAEIAMATETALHRFLTFRSEGRLYALPAGMIAEVIRMPSIARVPQGPKCLLGLANLRGFVLPVASIRAILGRSETATTPSSRLIVLDGTAPVALSVDEVAALVNVDETKVSSADAELAAETGELLKGVFRLDSNVAKILDIENLLKQAFTFNVSRHKSLASAPRVVAAKPAEDVRQRLVTFDVADQEYALYLDAVREIVPAPEQLTSIPGSDDAVRGVMAYRDALLPLLSLRTLLGLPAGIRLRERVLVTAIGGVQVGLAADRTRAIFSVDAALIEPTPSLLNARAGGETKIKAIYRAENGRLISILAPEQLFREDVMLRLAQIDAPTRSKAMDTSGGTKEQDLRFLVFRLGDDEFALPIDAIDEVARVPDQITRLPKTPKFLEGVVNLRGDVLPVVDQRRRFDMPTREGSADRRLVVVRTERHRAGLIVDSVSEVLRCGSQSLKPAPDLTGEALALVRSVINLESAGRIILLLDPSELLSRAERGLLDTFSKEMRGKKPRQA
jgi:purine-binding chemotaxis protein CheW